LGHEASGRLDHLGCIACEVGARFLWRGCPRLARTLRLSDCPPACPEPHSCRTCTVTRCRTHDRPRHVTHAPSLAAGSDAGRSGIRDAAGTLRGRCRFRFERRHLGVSSACAFDSRPLGLPQPRFPVLDYCIVRYCLKPTKAGWSPLRWASRVLGTYLGIYPRAPELHISLKLLICSSGKLSDTTTIYSRFLTIYYSELPEITRQREVNLQLKVDDYWSPIW
jgi:hypothetical protein